MNTLKYLAHYDKFESTRKRKFSIAAVNKMDYILRTLSMIGIETLVLSAAATDGLESDRGYKEEIYDNVFLKLFPVLGREKRIKRIFSILFFNLQLGFSILKEVKKNDTLIVYHSLELMPYIKFLKKIRRFNLILEIEEIYGDIRLDSTIKKKELDYFKLADGYIICSEILEKAINTEKKPSVVIYGTYKTEERITDFFDDGKIHCVYAGSVHPRKGGALTAVKLAEKLPDNYVIHLLCVGISKKIADAIKTVNEKGGAQVVYEGLFKGREYSRFLQSCHIGLSTQNPNELFNQTSFPSKILSYMANGLRVVSSKIDVLEKSELNDLLYYYEENDTNSIVEAVKSVDFTAEYDCRSVVEALDNNFKNNLIELINCFKER